ncbi:sensor histidine kinase [Chloroflexota bacterium]
MKKKQVMIVEDEGIIAKDIEYLIKDLGYAVPAIADTGKEAIDKARKIRPDLVLMDIYLKGDMDGVQAAEEIRDRFDIPVVYLSAYGDDEIIQRAKVTEPYGYILKPIRERELFIAIEIALYKHDAEKKLKERGQPSGIRNSDPVSADKQLQPEITDHDQIGEQIKALLEEKNMLLKEIPHRVKNNLQIICSILSIQSRYTKNKEVLEILSDNENRIQSMALIYEKLYLSESLTKIAFGEYIRSLTTNLFRSFSPQSSAVTLELNTEDVLMSIDTAIPCGLILNELVSNCLKHAFPAGRKGKMSINFNLSGDDKLVLVVSDNGAGFPKKFNLQSVESLGLQLVVSLVNQLNATIELDSSAGSTFRIVFAARVV